MLILDTIPSIELKQVSKEYSKRFAGENGNEIFHLGKSHGGCCKKVEVPVDSGFLDLEGELVSNPE